jgi:hypothetical protein
MVRYSFPVGLFHPRLYAGLSRRSRRPGFLPAPFREDRLGFRQATGGLRAALFRLRSGDWRVIFRYLSSDAIEVVRVRNRREAYR